MTDTGVEIIENGHIHVWQRGNGTCVECGEPVPTWLAACWDRYAEKTGE